MSFLANKPGQTLKESLAEWSNWDAAAYNLGVSLGLFDPGKDPFVKVKGVFWTENPMGRTLHAILLSLVNVEVLESQDGGDSFRWKSHGPL